jgi:hypothetical protein
MKNIQYQTISTLKPGFLTKAERALLTLSADLKAILFGSMLGDLSARKQGRSVNAMLCFEQGLGHKAVKNNV